MVSDIKKTGIIYKFSAESDDSVARGRGALSGELMIQSHAFQCTQEKLYTFKRSFSQGASLNTVCTVI